MICEERNCLIERNITNSKNRSICQICTKEIKTDNYACFACNGLFHLDCYNNLIKNKIRYCPLEDCQKVDTLIRSFSTN